MSMRSAICAPVVSMVMSMVITASSAKSKIVGVRTSGDTCAMLHTRRASPAACRGANGAAHRWPAGQPSSVEQPPHTSPLRPAGQSQRCKPHQ